jgi:hypothetical protein
VSRIPDAPKLAEVVRMEPPYSSRCILHYTQDGKHEKVAFGFYHLLHLYAEVGESLIKMIEEYPGNLKDIPEGLINRLYVHHEVPLA